MCIIAIQNIINQIPINSIWRGQKTCMNPIPCRVCYEQWNRFSSCNFPTPCRDQIDWAGKHLISLVFGCFCYGDRHLQGHCGWSRHFEFGDDAMTCFQEFDESNHQHWNLQLNRLGPLPFHGHCVDDGGGLKSV